MFVGPDDPLFQQGGVGGRAGPRGPWGGDGYLPPLGAPPGARFDPIGPGMGPFGPGGVGGRPRGPGGPMGGQFRGDPDNDEFMPPGGVSCFFALSLWAVVLTIDFRAMIVCTCDEAWLPGRFSPRPASGTIL